VCVHVASVRGLAWPGWPHLAWPLLPPGLAHHQHHLCAARNYAMRVGTPKNSPISTMKDLVDFGNQYVSHPSGKVQRRRFS